MDAMIAKRVKTMDKSDWVVLALLSLIVSACAIFGISYVVGEGWPIFHLSEEILLSLILTPVIGVILVLLETFAYKCALAREKRKTFIGPPTPTLGSVITRVLEKLTPKLTAKSVIGFSLLMGLLWLPWYIANFPGGTYWDTYYQIFQVYPENHPIAVIPWAEIYDQTLTDAWLVDHHPIFTTLVYGAFGWISDQLTGNWMAGVALFCILQGLAHNFAFTISVAYLRKIGSPKTLNFLAYWFFALMPFVSTWALCMVKDSFFGLFYVPYFMMLIETIRTGGQTMRHPRNAFLFALCALMLCLTKKTGIFVIVATCVIGAIIYAVRAIKARKQIRKGAQSQPQNTNVSQQDEQQVVCSDHSLRTSTDTHAASVYQNCLAALKALLGQGLACFVVMMLILPQTVFPALNIQPGGLQETLGPMFQQTARFIVDYPDDVTIKERNAISKVLDYEKLEDEYTFDFEDSVKYRYNLDATKEELIDYFKVYIAQGLRHPDSYFGAIACLAGFYVAPTAYINIRMVTVDTKMGDDDRYMLWNPDELDPLRNGLDEAYTAVGETPIINLPLLIVTYALWLPALLAYIAWRNRLKSLLLFIPPLVLLAFCVIAPVYDGRYVVPIFDAAPLFLCGIIALLQQKIASVRRMDSYDASSITQPSTQASTSTVSTTASQPPNQQQRNPYSLDNSLLADRATENTPSIRYN